MGPLSAKQQREYLKFQNKEAREVSKMGLDEMRKQQLHEIKLQEAAAKANISLGHKEQVNKAKLSDMSIKAPKVNREKLGLPSLNPMAGTDMFRQGQHRLATPVFQAKGTDTVPAMLTPGEAVIPRAAAQDPKNKKAIKRMVQEGRKANAMRDGAVDVRYSDAPGQAKYHAQGTDMVVPSLAYEHPDVPGSSYEDGTERVYDFKRGSAQQANYADGTEHVFSRGSPDMQHYSSGSYGVVPQQVQSAAGYSAGTVDVNNMLATIPRVAPHRKVRGYFQGEEQVANLTDEEKKLQQEQQVVPVIADAQPNVVGSNPEAPATMVQVPEQKVVEVPKPTVVETPVVAPAVVANPTIVTQTQQPAEAASVVPAPAPLAEMTTDQLIERDKANVQNTPVASTTAPVVPPKQITDPVIASAKVKDVSEYVQMLMGTTKNEKSLTDSLTNLFTANGFKEELGLNNQDIVRMAISTIVGAKRYGVQRALAYAGRQAFEESSKRNAQQQADMRSIRSAAVQLHAQDMNAKKAIDAENARYEHQRRDQAWRDTKEDVKAQRTMVTASNKEFNDLVPYVPKELKAQQAAISKETFDKVSEARAKNDLKGEYDAWTFGTLRIAQIADKTPKGTVVRNETPVSMQPTVVRNNTTGENVTAYFNPKTTGYMDNQGRAIDMSRHTPYSTNKIVDDQVKDYLKSAIPTHTTDSKGKSIKIDNHDQVVTAALLASQEMGINTKDPVAFGQIANQGFRLLEATKKPINADNMAMAMHASTLKMGADSTLTLIKRETTDNKKFLQVANDDEQLKIASNIMDLTKRLEKDAGRKIPMQKVMADVEKEFNDFKMADTAKYNNFIKELPLNQSPAIVYYNKRLEEIKKEKKE